MNTIEITYAIAEIEWNIPEDAGVVRWPCRFDNDDERSVWCEVYLDRTVVPGDVTLVPIAAASGKRLRSTSVFRAGEPFTLAFGDAVQAQGRTMFVRQSAANDSETLFQQILARCQEPTTEVMRDALVARAELTQSQADHITYLAGFTHSNHAAPLFENFGLTLDTGSSGERSVPLLVDSRRQTRHVKVLVDDLAHEAIGLFSPVIAEKYRAPMMSNRVFWREPNETYVRELSTLGLDFAA